ncbi:unnamed protein product, partial [Arabidopsis halleri]
AKFTEKINSYHVLCNHIYKVTSKGISSSVTLLLLVSLVLLCCTYPFHWGEEKKGPRRKT